MLEDLHQARVQKIMAKPIRGLSTEELDKKYNRSFENSSIPQRIEEFFIGIKLKSNRKDKYKMYYKLGTIKELEEIKDKIPEEVYTKIHDILMTLDNEYGADRNIDESDGGFVVYSDNQDGIDEAIKVMHLDKKMPELVDSIGGYLNALYLRHNEYGVNFITPRDSKSKNKFRKWGIKYDV